MKTIFTIKYKNWTIEEETGYRPITTAYMDLSIAEPFGVNTVTVTAHRLQKAFGGDYKELTELVMALNWKIWEHYQTRPNLARVYNRLWEEASAYAESHLEGEQLEYYYRTID